MLLIEKHYPWQSPGGLKKKGTQLKCVASVVLRTSIERRHVIDD
jgi:hypothetical protein